MSKSILDDMIISLGQYSKDIKKEAQQEFDFSDINMSPGIDTITLNEPSSITLGSGTMDYTNSIYTGPAGPTITTGASAGIGTLTGGYIYTTNGTSTGWDTINYPNPNHGSLQVNGDANFEGDIKIKGKSLVDSLEKIEEKLAILRPNEELESRWDKLRELRQQYMELEKELIQKEKMWDILKK